MVSTANVSCSLESVKSERGWRSRKHKFSKRYWFFLFPLPNRDSLVSVGNLRSILTPMTRFNLIELSRHYRSIALRKTGFSEGSHKIVLRYRFFHPPKSWTRRKQAKEWEGCGKQGVAERTLKVKWWQAKASNFIAPEFLWFVVTQFLIARLCVSPNVSLSRLQRRRSSLPWVQSHCILRRIVCPDVKCETRCTQSDSVIAFYTNEVHYMLGVPTHSIIRRQEASFCSVCQGDCLNIHSVI